MCPMTMLIVPPVPCTSIVLYHFGALKRFFHANGDLVLPVWIAPPTRIKSIGIHTHAKYW